MPGATTLKGSVQLEHHPRNQTVPAVITKPPPVCQREGLPRPGKTSNRNQPNNPERRTLHQRLRPEDLAQEDVDLFVLEEYMVYRWI